MRAGFSLQGIGLAYRDTVICCLLNWTIRKMMVLPFSYVNFIKTIFIERKEVRGQQWSEWITPFQGDVL